MPKIYEKNHLQLHHQEITIIAILMFPCVFFLCNIFKTNWQNFIFVHLILLASSLVTQINCPCCEQRPTLLLVPCSLRNVRVLSHLHQQLLHQHSNELQYLPSLTTFSLTLYSFTTASFPLLSQLSLLKEYFTFPLPPHRTALL